MKLSKSNQKLGETVWSWSIPAVKSCPGSSSTCRSSCYARTHRYRFSNVQNRLAENFQQSRQPNFWEEMVQTIRDAGAVLVRIHSSGDFFNAEYVRQWIRVARKCPNVSFWAYTRSWRIAPIARQLKRLAALPNMTLYYSCDRDTGLPKKIPAQVRTAYLQSSHEDVPSRHVDLVFRPLKLRKKLARTIRTPDRPSVVCPTETGHLGAHSVHCSTCQKCFEAPTAQASAGRIPLALV